MNSEAEMLFWPVEWIALLTFPQDRSIALLIRKPAFARVAQSRVRALPILGTPNPSSVNGLHWHRRKVRTRPSWIIAPELLSERKLVPRYFTGSDFSASFGLFFFPRFPAGV